MNKKNGNTNKTAGYRFFLTFCITLSVLTIVCVLFISFIYRPEIGKSAISSIKSLIPSSGNENGKAPNIEKEGRRDGVYTVLVCGTDYDGTRTDTMLLVTIDTKNDTINVLSIPRDTLAYMESGSIHKINAAHNKGSERMMIEVTNTIGFKPDNYVVLDYGDFKKIIDAIDGVDVYVPMDMYYIADDMTIDLKKGQQILNGNQALMFMRYREGYPDADLGRIRAQQTVFISLAGKLMSAQTIFKAPALASILFNDIETDFTLSEIVWLGIKCIGMDYKGFSVDMIPGHISGANYAVDDEEALALINEKYNPYKKPISILNTPK